MAKSNDPGYFQGYYAENREKILGNRRERYQNDPEYKEKVLRSSREYRKNQRREPRVKTKRLRRPVTGTSADGTEVQLCSAGALAILLQRSVQAINDWQKKGLLPETPYRDTRGLRYFTPEMMLAVQRVVGDKRRLYPVDPHMLTKIRDRWIASGVPMDYSGEDLSEAIRLTTRPASVAA